MTRLELVLVRLTSAALTGLERTLGKGVAWARQPYRLTALVLAAVLIIGMVLR